MAGEKAKTKEEAAPVAAPEPEPAPTAPLTLADKIRKLAADQQASTAVVAVLLEIAEKLESLGRAIAR